jgi:hypothetical protein
MVNKKRKLDVENAFANQQEACLICAGCIFAAEFALAVIAFALTS